jgi:hypothetical protein
MIPNATAPVDSTTPMKFHMTGAVAGAPATGNDSVAIVKQSFLKRVFCELPARKLRT